MPIPAGSGGTSSSGLDVLATSSDLAARLGRALTAEETARADALLVGASGRVRAYTGQAFTAIASDVVTLIMLGDTIRLPQRPVTGVTSVVAIGTDGQPDAAVAGWTFDGVDTLTLPGNNIAINAPEWWSDTTVDTFQVTYSHGYTTIPDVVVDVVCAMVLRALTSPSTAGGVVGETIGSYSYRLGDADGGIAVRLTDTDKEDLEPYRAKKRAGTIRMRTH